MKRTIKKTLHIQTVNIYNRQNNNNNNNKQHYILIIIIDHNNNRLSIKSFQRKFIFQKHPLLRPMVNAYCSHCITEIGCHYTSF